MGSAKLIEVPDEAALRAVERLLREHSKQGEAEAVNLIFTGKRLQDLFELEGLATLPHYGIHGFLGSDPDVARLLAVGPVQVFLNLHYPWGVLSVGYRSATGSGKGFLDLDLEPPSPGWLLQGVLGGLLPTEGTEQVLTSSGGREGIHLSFSSEAAGRVDGLLREVVRRLEPPLQVHVILTGDLKTVRELHESGRVVPCTCCAWHFEYVDLLAQESDVDPARLEQVAGFLAKRLGRDRSLTFRGFAWSWEEGSDPSLANGVVWSVPKRGPGSIEVRWYDPMPRGTLGGLKEEVRQFLSSVVP